MNSLQTAENEIRQFLLAQDNLSHEDRVRALMAIFSKHFEFSKLKHEIQHWDVGTIASFAKLQFSNQTLPMFISRKQVPSDHLVTVALLEAVLSYLNGKGLLSKEISINYTDGKI